MNSHAQKDHWFLLVKGALDMTGAFCTADPDEKAQSLGCKTLFCTQIQAVESV